ncbi:tRNA-dihydrouridine synthase [Candidatus Woesearchaeota archaeon]|nr:tRNA-dihydrouridine synthase [Candidatus Woesearchaeota archaeon]
MNLGRLKIKNKFLLAPMAIYTDTALRRLCSDYGASFTFTELISTAGFIRKTDSFRRRCDFHDENFGVQFISNSPDELKQSIEIVKNQEFYEGIENIKSIDLNLGCPSKNIMEQNLGSALLNQPNLVRELFKTMNKHSHLPISVKIRLGIDSKHKRQSKPYLKIAKIAEEENMDFVTVHARTSGQGYEGEVDLNAVKEIHDEVNIPLIGNGNITDVKSCKEMLKISDAVMIGRQAVKDPFIFKQFIEEIDNKKKWNFDFEKEKRKCIDQYLNYAKEYNVGFQHIKVHMQSFLKGLENHKQTMIDLTHTKNMDDIYELLKRV